MAAFVIVNGITYELHGVLIPVGEDPPETPEFPPQTGLEVTPTMTGPSTGGFTASATSEYFENGAPRAEAWKAFDGAAGSGWWTAWSSNAKATSSAPQILTLLFPSALPVYSYRVTIRTDTVNLSPLAWTLEGLANGQWVAVDAVSGLVWALGEEKTFTLDTPGLYAGLRWRCTDSGAHCQMQRVRIFS